MGSVQGTRPGFRLPLSIVSRRWWTRAGFVVWAGSQQGAWWLVLYIRLQAVCGQSRLRSYVSKAAANNRGTDSDKCNSFSSTNMVQQGWCILLDLSSACHVAHTPYNAAPHQLATATVQSMCSPACKQPKQACAQTQAS